MGVKNHMSNPNVQPVAQDFVVAAKVTDPELFFLRNPNLTRLDDGGLLLAVPQWPLQGSDEEPSLRIVRSVDHGAKWQELPTLPFEEGTPFVIDGQLLMFVQQSSHKGFQVVSSDNQGETWCAPRTVLEGPLFNNSTSMVTLPEAVFWAVDYDGEDERHHGKVMLRLDRGKPPLDPDLQGPFGQPKVDARQTVPGNDLLPIEAPVGANHPQPVVGGGRSFDRDGGQTTPPMGEAILGGDGGRLEGHGRHEQDHADPEAGAGSRSGRNHGRRVPSGTNRNTPSVRAAMLRSTF